MDFILFVEWIEKLFDCYFINQTILVSEIEMRNMNSD